MRIGFASDFHAGALTHPRLLEAATDLLARQSADLLLLGGDFVSGRSESIRTLAPLLAEIPAPLGKYAVLGNHDIFAGLEEASEALDRAGVRILTNRNVRLAEPFSNVWVCGLDDPELGNPDPARALAGADGYRILLFHSPETISLLRQERFDLAFCGHTHGGQIALPGGSPVMIPRGRYTRKYHYGVFKVPGRHGGGTLVVSRGVGCDMVPVRLFAHSEVIICSIEGAGDVWTKSE